MTRTKKKEPVAKCGVCRKTVVDNSYALACDFGCNLWYHCECVGVSVEQHDRLAASDEKWFCDKCGLINDKIVLNEEINNLTQTINLIQSDYEELKKLYDGVKTQNVKLGELCLKREEEVVRLQEELESCRNNLRGGTRTFDGSLVDFPPLRLTNRFSCLPLDVDGSQTAGDRQELSRSWNGCEPRHRAARGPKRSWNTTTVHRSTRTQSTGLPLQPTINSKNNLSFAVTVSSTHLKASTPVPKTFTKLTNSKTKITRPCPTPNVSERSSSHSKNTIGHRKSVMILGDSHCRDLSFPLQNQLGNDYNVFTLCRSGARISDVLSDVEVSTKNLTKSDYAVVVAGSNDIEPNLHTVVTREVENKLDYLKNKTNVILVTLPPRYDEVPISLTEAISRCNTSLLNQWSDKFPFVEVSSLKRHLFTRQGQHLNKRGKSLLCRKLSQCILNLLSDNKESFLPNVTQEPKPS